MVVFSKPSPALLAVCLLAASCSSVTDRAPSTRGADVSTSATQTSTSAAPTTTQAPSTTRTTEPPLVVRDLQDASDTTLQQIAQIEVFWSEVDDELAFTYSHLDSSRLFPRSVLEDGSIEGICTYFDGPELLDPDDVEANAYVTECDEGITVVWDNLDLVPDLEQRYPGAGIAMLFAHEWGHVIQLQREQFNQTVLLSEQQADCYSGAYAAWAEEAGFEPFTNPRALDQAIISTLETRDEVGSSPDDEGAHGNGFDRVRATQEGYDRGVAFCAAYDVTPPPITQIEFLDAQDAGNSGNLPFLDAIDLLSAEVQTWFESLTDESLDEFVELPDNDILRDLYDVIGDNAIGTEYALRYGLALQQAVGDETDGEGPALQRACLVGAWLFDVGSGGLNDGAGALSPGDLDEAIQTLSTSDELLSNPGLVFEMVASLRVGTLEGLDACAIA